MEKSRTWRNIVFSDLGILILLALAKLVLHALTNGQYGWHRDELDILDNARYLAWGYVSYPPVTPFIARVGLVLFGPSLVGLRFFSSLAMCGEMVLAGLMARELGGSRVAQITAALAVGIAPISLLGGALVTYSSFDSLWWVLIAYLMIRLLKSDDPRWWLGIGVVIGLGMMTKYTMSFMVAGIVTGVLLTRARRYLTSPWLWGGMALSLLIFLPNLVWQMQHAFISLEFTSFIHARDIRIGRADGFLVEQLIFSANLVTIPLWVAGLYFYLIAKAGQRFRPLGWMFVVPFVLFLATKGRSYYLAAAYPMLLASGAVLMEQWLASLRVARARLVQGITFGAFAVSGVVFASVALPVAPINSPWWDFANGINGELKEEIGWPELVQTVAGIYAALPAQDKLQAGILTDNYGEAGAINLYGPTYGLPKAISGVNSYWLRGYGNPPPQTLIVLGFSSVQAYRVFESCQPAGLITNRYGVRNEETRNHSVILLCRGPRGTWPELWKSLRSFG